jgi:glycosyltransferase involved in cell wall biosynthesis
MDPTESSPLVTVLIGVFDRTCYLRAALESALQQSYAHLEILVVNDGGMEEIDAIVAIYHDPRIRYIRRPQNLGLPVNFLRAFEEARGSLCAFLNDDDVWEPDFVAKMVEGLAGHPEATVAFCDHSIMDAEGRIDLAASAGNSRHWGRADLRAGRQQPFREFAVRGTVPVAMAAVFRRQSVAWDDFPLEVGMCYDLWLGYLLSREGGAAYYVPERLTRYRAHENTLTFMGRNKRMHCEIFIFDRILADPRFATCHTAVRQRRASAEAHLGYELLQQGKPSEARDRLRVAWKTIRRPKVAAAMLLSFFPGSLVQASWKRIRHLKRRAAALSGGGAG